MTSRRPFARPFRAGTPARRSIAAVSALVVGSSVLLLTATSASATTIADPGTLIDGGIASFSGTCADSPWAEFQPSWDAYPASFEVDDRGSWSGAYYVGAAGPATITVTCGTYDGIDFVPLEDPVTIDVTIAAPMLEVTATVGIDPATCATTDAIVVAPGTTVYWCYRATNRTGQTKDFHEISDSVNGLLVEDAPYDLVEDASIDTFTLGITSSTVVQSSMSNTVEWDAYGLDGDRYATVTGTATAQVTVSPAPTSTTTTIANPTTTGVTSPSIATPGQPAASPVAVHPRFAG